MRDAHALPTKGETNERKPRGQPDVSPWRKSRICQSAPTSWRVWRCPVHFLIECQETRAVSYRSWPITSPSGGPISNESSSPRSDRVTYLKLLQQNSSPMPKPVVLAWCLMTNHIHLVLVPGREDSLEVLFRRLHGRYAQMVNAKRVRSGHLWQNRFFSCALSSSHLRRALAYVERNPVRAGYGGASRAV